MKNIEINIKEQDNYEALLPVSISNVVYSSDTVNSMFNLSSGSMIDDAFSAINTNFNPLMANLGIEDDALMALKEQFGLMIKTETEAETVS